LVGLALGLRFNVLTLLSGNSLCNDGRCSIR
jgi:hypothetical protein